MPLSYLRTGYAREPVRGRGAVGGRGDPVSGPERLATGAELRRHERRGAARGRLRERRPEPRGRRAPGAPSLEWLVRRARAAVSRARLRRGALPDQVVAARSSSASRTAAPRSRRSTRPTLLLGFSMGGAVAISAADDPRVVGRARARALDPERLDLSPLAGKRLDVIHGSLDRWLPGHPRRLGDALAARLRAGTGARRRGQLHARPRRRARARAAARRAASCRSSRAASWSRLVAAQLEGVRRLTACALICASSAR